MAVRRHCLVCGALSTRSRCPAHDYRAKGNAARGYGAEYRRASGISQRVGGGVNPCDLPSAGHPAVSDNPRGAGGTSL